MRRRPAGVDASRILPCQHECMRVSLYAHIVANKLVIHTLGASGL